MIVGEKLCQSFSCNNNEVVHRLINSLEGLFPRQHHVDHAQVVVRVLVADVNSLQTSQHLRSNCFTKTFMIVTNHLSRSLDTIKPNHLTKGALPTVQENPGVWFCLHKNPSNIAILGGNTAASAEHCYNGIEVCTNSRST